MPSRSLRSPRQLVVAFLAVALVSTAALAWLGWLLLQQDAALDVQRRQDRLEQAADRATAVMQRSIAGLQARTAPQVGRASLPDGVVIITVGLRGITVQPEGALAYYPVRDAAAEAPADAFAVGERLEFAANDLPAAAAVYRRSAAGDDAAIRAGALVRLARVSRKAGETDAALRAYDQLAAIDGVAIGGLPASLVARIGRGSVLKATGQDAALRQEAEALAAGLARGRWQLLEAEYEFYSGQADAWLGAARRKDVDALVRAEAAVWLWDNRPSLETAERKAVVLPSGPALLVWQPAAGGAIAAVAGPVFLASLCSESVPADLRCGLSDSGGRVIAGEASPAPRAAAIRTAADTGLPWVLHVSTTPRSGKESSPRRQLLLLSFVIVALVLAAGWYFILRAMAREVRLSRLQSDFVAAVSHEFRSPLTSLSHVAYLLADDRISADDQRRTSYDVLVRESDRLKRLVEGLLDFGRFEAGAAALRLEVVDVAAFVRATVADFQDRVRADGFRIELEGADRAVSASIDAEALGRALWNLLDNAVKYSPDCRTVWVEMSCTDGLVAIAVRDQGLGIPSHEQRDVFDRFVRGAESRTRRVRGTGIGLALVREIARAHGGEVQLTSELGRGSRFTLVFPATAGAAA